MKNLLNFKKTILMSVVMMCGIFVLSSCEKIDFIQNNPQNNSKASVAPEYDFYYEIAPNQTGQMNLVQSTNNDLCSRTSIGNGNGRFSLDINGGGYNSNYATFNNLALDTYYLYPTVPGGPLNSNISVLKITFSAGFTPKAGATYNFSTKTWSNFVNRPGVTMQVYSFNPYTC